MWEVTANNKPGSAPARFRLSRLRQALGAPKSSDLVSINRWSPNQDSMYKTSTGPEPFLHMPFAKRVLKTPPRALKFAKYPDYTQVTGPSDTPFIRVVSEPWLTQGFVNPQDLRLPLGGLL